MRVLGVTGGVATGKSLVARFLEELGAAVVDADQLAREVVEPGEPALEEIRQVFGPGVLTPEGRLDRKALARRVFSDEGARRRLEAIIHPRVRRRMEEAVARLREAGAPLIVLEIPLLFEGGEPVRRLVDRVLVVTAPEAVQLERLRQRNGLTEAEARARMAAQMPLEEKVRRADYVVDNGGTPEETRRQVQRVWEAMRREDRTDRPR
ncbi:dephospho-CoA kinase [Limnochorda pilosa]|uniref:Dephospho-CoA kinase n=1 Tax=Limnochorda pilosa TaxID=1555112 RepID=A0A0K2SK05_LIMPI|nr:dephospho-CoA kinase [Limnochorda pilosa]